MSFSIPPNPFWDSVEIHQQKEDFGAKNTTGAIPAEHWI